jgi:hypothetical protein
LQSLIAGRSKQSIRPVPQERQRTDRPQRSRQGNPGYYRDYRSKRMPEMPLSAEKYGAVPVSMKL